MIDSCHGYSDFTDSHITFGEALIPALSEYRDGGKGRRIKTLVEEVISGESDRDRNSIFVENSESDDDGLSTDPAVSIRPSPSAEIVIDVAESLPESFPVTVLDSRIEEHASDEHETLTDELIAEYRDAVVDQLPVVGHPMKDDLFITEDAREDITAWQDYDNPGRVQYLREMALNRAEENRKQRVRFNYTDVIDLFDEHLGHSPTPQYAYDAMEDAATAEGFSYSDHHGKKELRCDRLGISESLRADVLLKWDFDPWGETPEEAETAESGDIDTREADSDPCDPEGEAGKTGKHDTDQWVRDATDNLPPGDVSNLPDAVIDNKIARARDVDGPADLDGDGNVPQSLLDRVSEDDRQRVRDHASADSEDNNSETPNVETGAVDDELNALQQATPEAMTDGGSDTGIHSE